MSELNLTHSNGNKVKLTTPDSLSANKTFKLPSADGSAYSPIITDGSGALSFSSLKLPSSDGSSGQAIVTNGSNTLSFATVATTNGITMADQWRITSSSTLPGSVSILNSNWGRATSPAGYGTLGSAMTESSGAFTFPSTGIYFIEFTVLLAVTQSMRYLGNRIQTTTNNFSGANTAAETLGHMGLTNSFGAYHTSSSSLIFDVTNTSTHKIRFCAVSFTPSATDVIGNANQNSTFVTFIRLGDT